jgi:hypothetical protein
VYRDGSRVGRPWFESGPAGVGGFLYSTEFRPAPGPTQPPIQRAPGAISPGVTRSGREADHSPPSSAEVKNGGAIPRLPQMSSWHIAELIKHGDNFTFYWLAHQYVTCLFIGKRSDHPRFTRLKPRLAKVEFPSDVTNAQQENQRSVIHRNGDVSLD